jgi:hypothetical protein
MIQKGKAKLTIPHPFCKCGWLIKGRYCKIWGYYHKWFLKVPAIEYSAVYLKVFLNLLSNALKYSSPLRTKIHFQSQIINDETVLTVCDNGLELKRNMGQISLDLTKCSIRPKGVGLFPWKPKLREWDNKCGEYCRCWNKI